MEPTIQQEDSVVYCSGICWYQPRPRKNRSGPTRHICGAVTSGYYSVTKSGLAIVFMWLCDKHMKRVEDAGYLVTRENYTPGL